MAKQKKNYDVLDKAYITNQYKIQAFNKLFAMFKYNNLPETIPQRNLEKILLHGYACIAKVDEKLYAFEGGLGGEPDVYYNPTICTVTNPALNLSKDFVIDKDCIIIRNDSNMQGMDFLVDKFSSAMCENDITSYLAGVNNRLTMILSAGDNRTKEAAEKFLKDIAQGKLAVVAESTFVYRGKDNLELGFFIIIENAMKYSLESRTISVEFVEYPNKLIVRCQNWGLRPKDDELSKITQRGYRAKIAVNKGDVPGSGLGLYLLSQICDENSVDLCFKLGDERYYYDGWQYSPFIVELTFRN